MSRKVIITMVLGILSLVLVAGISYAVSSYEQAKIIAEEQFPKLLEDTIKPNNRHFGFPNKGQYAKVSLGEPLEHYRIDFGSFDANIDIDDQMKQDPFYTFPVMVDEKASIDIAVGTNANGVWDVIDVGGGLNKTVSEMSQKHGLSESRVLHFEGAMLIIAKMGDKQVGYTPYDALGAGLKERLIVSEDEIIKTLVRQHERVQEFIKNGGAQGEIGGPAIEIAPRAYKQEGIFKRLSRYVEHAI